MEEDDDDGGRAALVEGWRWRRVQVVVTKASLVASRLNDGRAPPPCCCVQQV